MFHRALYINVWRNDSEGDVAETWSIRSDISVGPDSSTIAIWIRLQNCYIVSTMINQCSGCSQSRCTSSDYYNFLWIRLLAKQENENIWKMFNHVVVVSLFILRRYNWSNSGVHCNGSREKIYAKNRPPDGTIPYKIPVNVTLRLAY